ncbi:hypothetical protein, partial [Mycolicibacterium insubricum]|uniref:hypothetical protein n=1 Tax=Mycolicibacterium insubricum TaxID=444597 RepID=UPI0021F372C5
TAAAAESTPATTFTQSSCSAATKSSAPVTICPSCLTWTGPARDAAQIREQAIDAVAPSGTVYPGGGNPIGTSMVFSHLAAMDMANGTRR